MTTSILMQSEICSRLLFLTRSCYRLPNPSSNFRILYMMLALSSYEYNTRVGRVGHKLCQMLKVQS